MFGGLGHTSFVGSNGNLRGPTSGAAVASAFFFLLAFDGRGRATHRASSKSTPMMLRCLTDFVRKRNISISMPAKNAGHYFPGTTVSFMLSLFLWQLSQKAMLLTWSLT